MMTLDQDAPPRDAPVTAPEANRRIRILIVDDNDDDRMIHRHLLLSGGGADRYEVFEAPDCASGREMVTLHRPDCVLLDHGLPDGNGLDLTGVLRGGSNELDSVPFLYLTGNESTAVAVSAMKSGAADFLCKTQVSTSALRRAVGNAIEKSELRKEKLRTLETLQQRNHEIRSFYHMLSHELKTPLTVAIEFLALVLDEVGGPINDTQREYLEIARDSCRQLTGHINDILDVTRLETGKISLEATAGRIDEIVRDIIVSLQPTANSNDVELGFTSQIDDRPTVFDQRRITQVLNNLLNNALKFTPAGGEIHVHVGGDESRAWVSVKDTGPGIAAQHVGRVFERLYQATEDDAATYPGLGLGLNICRDLVEMHGGRIWVESEPGAGATFTFAIPRNPEDPIPCEA